MYQHLLVPIDGSDLGARLVTQAVRFAASLGARITFFTMREDYGSTSEGALARTLSPEAFSEASLGEANALLAKAIAAAGEQGVVCDGLARTGARAYEQILEVAAECGCDLIFMASHGRRGLKALMIGSQTQKVLAHATLPVLVATVEANVRCSAAESAVTIIKDEHRAIAAVCSGLREQAALARRGEAVDDGFVASMLHYLRAFPERLHHPKEEKFLFAKLVQRHPVAQELIATLEHEHEEGGRLLAELEQALAGTSAERREGGAAVALGEAIDRFVDAQWNHLNTEEKMVIPLALEQLRDEDWSEIESAFRENAGVGRGSDEDEAFRNLFSRLMNMRVGRRV